ncbi:MAG: isoprenylcysteine carboxylmethyltransferase family protein [Planctomycetes bacterium]|nr:isoprenylcysteine carboxylmethyltransferase family protein [Planctomycetota bacterium]
MAKGGFLKRHGIVRNAIREDMLYFALPGLFVFTAGLVVCAWDLVRRQEGLFMFSVHCVGGLALLIIGLIIMIVSQATLWRNYSSTVVIREDHQLITHGIYRFTRNPIYLGGIMAVCIGIPVYTSSLYGFLVMLILIPIILNRIRLEEKLLSEEFGDAYLKYKEATKKLIPFIY